MNHNTVITMNNHRPESRVVVYTPTGTKKCRRARKLLAAIDILTSMALMLCFVAGITVLIGLL